MLRFGILRCLHVQSRFEHAAYVVTEGIRPLSQIILMDSGRLHEGRARRSEGIIDVGDIQLDQTSLKLTERLQSGVDNFDHIGMPVEKEPPDDANARTRNSSCA